MLRSELNLIRSERTTPPNVCRAFTREAAGLVRPVALVAPDPGLLAASAAFVSITIEVVMGLQSFERLGWVID